MVQHGAALWKRHPHVGKDLSFGERAADRLKAVFGTWSLLFGIIAFILFWLVFITDPGELKLNLGLSFVASVQGVVLQIAANRGDRISAEVALHTQANTDELMALNRQQLEILTELRQLRADLADGAAADAPVRGGAGGNAADTGLKADAAAPHAGARAAERMVPPPAADPSNPEGRS